VTFVAEGRGRGFPFIAFPRTSFPRESRGCDRTAQSRGSTTNARPIPIRMEERDRHADSRDDLNRQAHVVLPWLGHVLSNQGATYVRSADNGITLRKSRSWRRDPNEKTKAHVRFT